MTSARMARAQRFVIPAVATVLFSLLLLHKSESPVVLNRYSAGYTTLLILIAVNLVLFWRKPALRLFHPPPVAPILLLVSLAFLVDFFVHGLLEFDFGIIAEANLACIGLVLIQASAPQRLLSRFAPKWKSFLIVVFKDAALVTSSVMCTLIIAELVLSFILVVRLTPKSEREFARLMSLQWPESISIEKANGTFRVLGLADSFGVVGGKSGNYHYLLEDLLRRQVSPRIQMVNVSVTGYEPRHELAMLRFAMPYAPDVVLHGFFVGNDFTLYGEDTYEYRGIRINDQPGISRYRPKHFFLVDLILNQLSFFRDLRQIQLEQRSGLVQESGYLSKKFFLNLQFQRMKYLYRKSENDDMKKIMPILDSIHHATEKGRARYVMIIHPDQTQVDEHLRKEIIEKFQVKEEDFDLDLPQKILMSYCAARGILCLDLVPAFRAEGKLRNLYNTRDGHYNLSGNQLAAARISQFLLEKRLIRGPIPEAQPGP